MWGAADARLATDMELRTKHQAETSGERITRIHRAMIAQVGHEGPDLRPRRVGPEGARGGDRLPRDRQARAQVRRKRGVAVD